MVVVLPLAENHLVAAKAREKLVDRKGMQGVNIVWHPSENEILDYMSSSGSPEQEAKLEDHIAGCPDCLRRLRALASLRENFDSVWDSLTAEEYGRAYERSRLTVAPENAARQTDTPSLAQQIEHWLARLEDTLHVALKAVLDPERGLAGLALAGAPGGLEFVLSPPAPGVGSRPAVEKHLRKGSEFLSQAQPELALKELEAAAKTDVQRAGASRWQVRRGGRSAFAPCSTCSAP